MGNGNCPGGGHRRHPSSTPVEAAVEVGCHTRASSPALCTAARCVRSSASRFTDRSPVSKCPFLSSPRLPSLAGAGGALRRRRDWSSSLHSRKLIFSFFNDSPSPMPLRPAGGAQLPPDAGWCSPLIVGEATAPPAAYAGTGRTRSRCTDAAASGTATPMCTPLYGGANTNGPPCCCVTRAVAEEVASARSTTSTLTGGPENHVCNAAGSSTDEGWRSHPGSAAEAAREVLKTQGKGAATYERWREQWLRHTGQKPIRGTVRALKEVRPASTLAA